MASIVYFIRHGETGWNREGRFQGQAEAAINETGRAQADRNGRLLGELISDPGSFDFVASPLGRTRETMQRIRAAMGLPPGGFRTDPKLIELNFGDWQGLTMEEIEKRRPGSDAARMKDKWGFCPPGADAESYAMLAERMKPWLDALDRPTVCVTHGGVIRAVFHHLGGMSGAEAAAFTVPQDKILMLENDRLVWL